METEDHSETKTDTALEEQTITQVETTSDNCTCVTTKKTVGEFNFSCVTVSPKKRKNIMETGVVANISKAQTLFSKTWKGMEVNFIGRPGLNNLATGKRKFTKADEFIELEEKKLRQIYKDIIRIKELEDEKLGIVSTSNSKKDNSDANKNGSDIVNFKLIKESQIIKEGGPPIIYSKNSYLDQGELQYKMLKTDGKLIRSVLEAHGFSHTEGHDWNILWTCTSCKPYLYEGLNEYQKINHFPQSFELTRKDNLCANVIKMQEKYGSDVFDIVPDTYILPDEFADFYSHFHSLKSKAKDNEPNMWIVKPSASSKGKGIYIIDDISEAPIKENCIISRYINNPLLINGIKFDIRLYVLATSFDPWRIYIYKEGLARFAAEPYNAPGGKTNRFSHLTNYSINKKHEKFLQNTNLEMDDEGNKWSLSALSRHLESIGVDMNLLWSRIYDIIIKSLLCIDTHVYTGLKKIPGYKNNCFELYGFDILLDNDLKPWILEANLSPSFATDSPLDLAIKSNLMTDMFNLICIRKMDRKRENIAKMKQRFKNYSRPKAYQSRGVSNPAKNANSSKLDVKPKNDLHQLYDKTKGVTENDEAMAQKLKISKLTQMSTKNRQIIRDTLIEDQRKGNFIRIYPCRDSDIYDPYFTTPRPSNKTVYKYLFTDELIPSTTPANFLYSSYNQNRATAAPEPPVQLKPLKPRTNRSHTGPDPLPVAPKPGNLAMGNPAYASAGPKAKLPAVKPKPIPKPEVEPDSEKLMITGDDVLIEYVSRLMIAIKSIKLKQAWKHCIEKFIRHYVWHSSDVRRRENNKLWQRLESRLIEMKERRKRLLRSLYKKELKGSQTKEDLNKEFERDYDLKEQQKNVIIQALSALELEDMLRTSTKNVAHEVVSCLVEPMGRGVLTDIIRWLTTSQHGVLNDHLSILDSTETSTKLQNYGEEDPEDCDDTESFYNTKSSMNTSGIRIKVRKSSVDPNSK